MTKLFTQPNRCRNLWLLTSMGVCPATYAYTVILFVTKKSKSEEFLSSEEKISFEF